MPLKEYKIRPFVSFPLSKYIEHINKLETGSMSIQDTLNERAQTHGHFPDVAYTSQRLRDVMSENGGWDVLDDAQREALTTIAMKISRILNGDASHIDSWHDISGYASLIENGLKREV